MRGSEDLLGAHHVHGLPLGPAQIFDLSFLLLAASLFALYHCWCARRAWRGGGMGARVAGLRQLAKVAS